MRCDGFFAGTLPAGIELAALTDKSADALSPDKYHCLESYDGHNDGAIVLHMRSCEQCPNYKSCPLYPLPRSIAKKAWC